MTWVLAGGDGPLSPVVPPLGSSDGEGSGGQEATRQQWHQPGVDGSLGGNARGERAEGTMRNPAKGGKGRNWFC